MPPGTLHHRHKAISTAPTSIIPPLFSSLLGQADPVTFTRHPRLTAARPAPSPAPSPFDRKPLRLPAAPPVPLFAHRVRFACSPVRPLGLDFDTLSCTCSLVVRSPFICLSPISFGRAAHEPKPTSSSGTPAISGYIANAWSDQRPTNYPLRALHA